ncbi:hypothetical protein G6F56_012978 [Rhizopus delemar]|nr:hypothetical protein G6F56_012978 [Rhizopus delemar]
MPAQFVDPSCVYCGDLDTEEHFVWACPVRKEIWQTIANRFFTDPSMLTFAHIACPTPSGPSVIPLLSLNSLDIIACTVLSIWQFHWKIIFDNRPFWPQEVAANATRLIRKLHKENSARNQFNA